MTGPPPASAFLDVLVRSRLVEKRQLARYVEGLPPGEAEFELAGDYARLVRRYARDPRGGGWPAGLVPAFYCGCTVFEFVDCRSPDGPVVWFDEGTEALSELLTREPVPSLAARLEAWLAGERPW
jgi:hypothetical protein